MKKQSSTLWTQPERYVVIQIHNFIYPVLPLNIKCKHKWLHERILTIRKEYDLFKANSFNENMGTHLISNMLTKWRTIQYECNSDSRSPKKPFSYFSFPVRFRLIHWRDSGKSDENMIKAGYFKENISEDVIEMQYKKSVLSPNELTYLKSLLTNEFISRLKKLYQSSNAEGPLYFYCEIAALFRTLVANKKVRPTVLLWKFEEAITHSILNEKLITKKRKIVDYEVDEIQHSKIKVVHN